MDPDNDYMKCRMAEGSYECGALCHGLRNFKLDEVSISYRHYAISAPTSCHYVINACL